MKIHFKPYGGQTKIAVFYLVLGVVETIIRDSVQLLKSVLFRINGTLLVTI